MLIGSKRPEQCGQLSLPAGRVLRIVEGVDDEQESASACGAGRIHRLEEVAAGEIAEATAEGDLGESIGATQFVAEYNQGRASSIHCAVCRIDQ